MKYIKKSCLLFLVIVGLTLPLFGATVSKPTSIQIKKIQFWKNSKEAWALQQSVRAIFSPRQNYPRSEESLDEIRRHFELFKKPLLILDTQQNDFGGFFALVAFKGYSKLFRIWIYEIDQGIFEIRDMIQLKEDINAKFISDHEDKRLVPYWLNSL